MKKMRKPMIAIAAVAVVLVAGVSVYAATNAPGGGINKSEAKALALAKVDGADESNITKAVKDMDDGRSEYDIEIVYDGYEYDIEIAAEDGSLLGISKEKAEADDMAKTKQGKAESDAKAVPAESEAQNGSDIGLTEAKSIALNQTEGASEADIVKAHKDYDDGVLEYEIEIHYNGNEYEYEINGETGEIISRDIEKIDNDRDDDRDDNDRDDDRDDRDDD